MSSRVLIIDGKEPNAGVGGVSAADFSHFSNRFLTAGVLGATDYLVEAQDTPDMSVKYAAGGAYVEDTTGTFNIPVEENTGGNVTIEPNVSGNDRIDTIVIAIDTTATPNENADDIIDVVAVQGTPAASPSPLTDNEIQTALGAGYAWLKLAEVTVENGAVSITGADVSDMRPEVGVQTGGIVLDEDDMVSNSAAKVPTQQSVKAYVDDNAGSDFRRHNDGALSTQSGVTVISGWGYIQGNNTANMTETISFGVTFAVAPVVIAVANGSKSSSVPTGITQLTGNTQSTTVMSNANVQDISTTQFTVNIARNSGTYGSSFYFGYNWIAIGVLA